MASAAPAVTMGRIIPCYRRSARANDVIDDRACNVHRPLGKIAACTRGIAPLSELKRGRAGTESDLVHLLPDDTIAHRSFSNRAVPPMADTAFRVSFHNCPDHLGCKAVSPNSACFVDRPQQRTCGDAGTVSPAIASALRRAQPMRSESEARFRRLRRVSAFSAPSNFLPSSAVSQFPTRTPNRRTPFTRRMPARRSGLRSPQSNASYASRRIAANLRLVVDGAYECCSSAIR